MGSRSFQWLNEPPEWQDDGSTLTIRTAPLTDFWRRTFEEHSPQGEVIIDNGHVYYETVDGDFRVAVKVMGSYRDQYDQAGLMIREDEENWIKFSPEVIQGLWADRYKYRMGSVCLGCAYTYGGRSEWNVLPEFLENPKAFWLRITREKRTFFVDFSLDGESFSLIKLLSFPEARPLMVGRYAASPTGDGFTARFEEYSVAQGVVHW